MFSESGARSTLGEAHLDAPLERVDPGCSTNESVGGADVEGDEAVEDADDLGWWHVLGEEVSMARVGSSVAADEDCDERGKQSEERKKVGENSLFHPLSVAMSPKSFD